MSITALFAAGCIGAIMTIIGLSGLCFQNRSRTEALEEQVRRIAYENKSLKRQVHKLRDRAASLSDKVTIVYEPDNSSAPDYGNF